MTVKNTSVTFPRISSTLPILRLFSRYTPALKYGTLSGIVHRHTNSDSQSCNTEPASDVNRNYKCRFAMKRHRGKSCEQQHLKNYFAARSRDTSKPNGSVGCLPTISAGGPSSLANLPPPPPPLPPGLRPPLPPRPRALIFLLLLFLFPFQYYDQDDPKSNFRCCLSPACCHKNRTLVMSFGSIDTSTNRSKKKPGSGRHGTQLSCRCTKTRVMSRQGHLGTVQKNTKRARRFPVQRISPTQG